MSEDLSQAAGRGVEIELRGKKWKLSPLTMGDLADFQGYLRSERLKAVAGGLLALPIEERTALLRQVVREPVDSADMDAEMASPAGSRYILWRSLRRLHPEMTLELVGDLITTADIEALTSMVAALSSGDDAEDPTAGT